LNKIENARRQYAESLSFKGHRTSAAVIQAFANVPREQFSPPGPWRVPKRSRLTGKIRHITTPDANPTHLYRDIPIAIDTGRMLHNGMPSFLALMIDLLALKQGDHVLHVGCGLGYYSAIMAHIVSESGHIIAVEFDPSNATQARKNLAALSQVTVANCDGTTYDAGAVDAILLNAGANHPVKLWLDSLKPSGRFILPLTCDDGGGVVFLVTRDDTSYLTRFVSEVGIFPCTGGRDPEAERRLRQAFGPAWENWMRRILRHDPPWAEVRRLRRDSHSRETSCWFHGNGFCFSR
jgi:protein-L-isoaspartate(D-aspartate) O-methyltransferase